MCGIFGIYDSLDNALNLKQVQTATTCLRHRGPDDEGFLLYNNRNNRLSCCGGVDTDPKLDLPSIENFFGEPYQLALGFRRLSILDLAITGHQPMSNSDGSLWIIFNGEIYNYLELRKELEKKDYSFRSRSDTEVLLTAYAEWGLQSLTRFVGMFAFAILDIPKRKLFLARDFFGIKPLYYTINQGKFAFSSEIKSLLSLSWVQSQANPQQIYDYLNQALSDHTSETFFSNIFNLPPAHYLEISLDDPINTVPSRYWNVQYNQQSKLSFDDAAHHLQELFLSNINLHLRSDVPVGVALSGGIDSSAIVMGMRQVQGKDLNIHSFSYIADDPIISEEKWVNIVGKSADAFVHKTSPSPNNLLADLDRLILTQDEPFGSTSIYAQNCVFRLAHQNEIKVMLDGQGADELLAGYHPYLYGRLVTLIHQHQFNEAIHFITKINRLSRSAKVKMAMKGTSLLLPASFEIKARQIFGHPGNSTWLNEEWFNQHGVSINSSSNYHQQPGLREQLYQNFVRTSLPTLLRYEDRNSMAYSIESRVPFLTPDLVNFIFSLPENYLINENGTSKAVLRKALRGIVPSPILDRKDKIGFETSEKKWLSALKGWVDSILNSKAMERVTGLRSTSVEQEWRSIIQGKSPFDYRIWRIVNLLRWAELFDVRFD